MKRTAKKILKFGFGVACTLILSGGICIGALAFYASNGRSVQTEEFKALARAQDRSTRLYYLENASESHMCARETEGETLYAEQNREWVCIENMPAELIDAFVAIEDHRFFEHGGVDYKRTAGAIIGFLSGKSSYGGSTLTQQLVKNITGRDEFSVSRKVKEMILAYKVDKELTKEEILELYLNTIYLSQGCYGVGTGAEVYFDKEASELTLTECAALACIPQSPTKWDPLANPENNKARRGTVLYRMLELGYINENEYKSASEEELNLSFGRTRKAENGKIYSWYTEAVIDESIHLLVEKGVAKNEQTAKRLLYTGGLKIITAQNPKMQNELEKYFCEVGNFYGSGVLIHPECAAVVIDPKTGGVLAIAGAIGEKKANRTLSYATSTYRSPGSSIKPLSVYAPALDKGLITYGAVIDDTPCKFVPDGMGGMRGWPQNYPRGYRGLTTVREAVARSVNTVAVKVLDELTPESSYKLLKNELGLSSLVSGSDKNGAFYTDIARSPLALGQLTKGVTVKDMTAAYTALANGGVFHKGKTVLKILDGSGRVLVDNEDEGSPVFSPQTAAIMTRLLAGVTNGGTASAIKLKSKIECVGKTGTTSNDCDRWFIGYTPDLLMGVWFGYPVPKSLDGYPHSPSPAVKTFDCVMERLSDEVLLGHPVTRHFPETEGVITAQYCRDSGKLVSSACLCDPRGSRGEVGYFTADTVPREYCDTHVLVRYDTVHGGIAGKHCLPENCRYIGLLRVERAFSHDVVISDSQYTYLGWSETHPPSLDAGKPYYRHYPGGSSCGRSGVSVPFNRYCAECELEKGKKDEGGSEDDAE